jgi:hypothetical protein
VYCHSFLLCFIASGLHGGEIFLTIKYNTASILFFYLVFLPISVNSFRLCWLGVHRHYSQRTTSAEWKHKGTCQVFCRIIVSFFLMWFPALFCSESLPLIFGCLFYCTNGPLPMFCIGWQERTQTGHDQGFERLYHVPTAYSEPLIQSVTVSLNFIHHPRLIM